MNLSSEELSLSDFYWTFFIFRHWIFAPFAVELLILHQFLEMDNKVIKFVINHAGVNKRCQPSANHFLFEQKLQVKYKAA